MKNIMNRIVFAALLVGAPLWAQPPGAAAGQPGRPDPGFDLSGYWSAPLHEDALERGAGPETADYGGFPLNEAGRLFALSYNCLLYTSPSPRD